MNKTKFFIVSIQRDYIVRFHAQAEDLVLGFQNRYPGYLFHVKKIEAHLFCFSVVPPEEADEAQTSAYTAELKSVYSRTLFLPNTSIWKPLTCNEQQLGDTGGRIPHSRQYTRSYGRENR